MDVEGQDWAIPRPGHVWPLCRMGHLLSYAKMQWYGGTEFMSRDSNLCIELHTVTGDIIPNILLYGKPNQSECCVLVDKSAVAHLQPHPFWKTEHLQDGSARLVSDRLTGSFEQSVQLVDMKVQYPSMFAPYYGLEVYVGLVMLAFDRPFDMSAWMGPPVAYQPPPKTRKRPHLDVKAKSVKGGTNKRELEDRFTLDTGPSKDRVYVYGVFDGHGGSTTSQMLSTTFGTVFYELFGAQEVKTITPMERRAHIQHTLRATFERMERQTETDLTGSCACVLAIDMDFQEIHCANCGDCFAFYTTHTGAWVPLSIDHNVRNSYEVARAFAAGGYCDPRTGRLMGVLLPTRAIGDKVLKSSHAAVGSALIAEPDLHLMHVPLSEVSGIFIASDGLALPNNYIDVKRGKTVDDWMDALHMLEDDRTLVYIRPVV
jgi:serine/threonine protein phosphatase PrpC